MPNLLLVMLGGAVGSGARYLVGRATLGWWGGGFPWGTLAVNLIGGFAMGMLAASLMRIDDSEPWRLLIGVGILGGFTTFSAFSLDLMTMIERGAWVASIGYALVSVAGSLATLALGMTLIRTTA